MATEYLFANNATTTLAQALSSTATVINVADGDGSLFPSPGQDQAFAITLVDAATGLLNEICYCTSRSGDQLTVTRGEEGTNARSWLAGDTCANFITADVIESWLQESDLDGYATEDWVSTGFEPLLGFTPVQQGGGVNQIGTKVYLGQDATYPGLRYSYNLDGATTDCGYLVSSYNTKLDGSTQVGDLTIGSDSRLAFQSVVMAGNYTVAANYADVQAETVRAQNAEATLVSGTYGKSSDDYQMLGMYQQETTGRPIAVYNNGTTEVFEGIAITEDITTVQSNLTSALAAQATQNSTFSSEIAARVPTNASNDGVNAPITLFNYYLGTGVPWFSAGGSSYNLVQTNPGSGWNQIKNISTENSNGTLTVLDTAGNTNNYAPSSDGTIAGGYYYTVGSLLIQEFLVYASDEETITFPMAFSSASVIIGLTAAHTPGSSGVADNSHLANVSDGTITATGFELDLRGINVDSNGAAVGDYNVWVRAVGLK